MNLKHIQMKKLLLPLLIITLLSCEKEKQVCIPCKAEIEKSWKLRHETINGNEVFVPELLETRYYFFDFREDDNLSVKALDTVQISKEDYNKIDFPVCNMDTIKNYVIY